MNRMELSLESMKRCGTDLESQIFKGRLNGKLYFYVDIKAIDT